MFTRLRYLVVLLILNLGIPAFANQNIKIALIAPFSGEYSAYGTLLLSGAMQATQDINAHDGIKGVDIEIIPFDDQCNPDIAVKLAESIVAAKYYQAVIGHTCSAATLAVTSIYDRANILMITPTATNSKITERKLNGVFRMIGTDQQQSITAANFIAKSLKSKRIAILHDQELYSKDLADLVSENLLRLGVTPVLYQGVARGTRNFTAVIKKLKALEADAIYFAGLYPEIASLAKTLNILELQIPILTADGIAINKFITQAGGTNISGSVLMTFGDNPANLVSSQKIINNMHKNNMETTGYALYAYAAVQVIATAIDHTNTTDGLTLANWLHQHEVNTIIGKKSWDTNGNVNNCKFKIYTLAKENTLNIIPINNTN